MDTVAPRITDSFPVPGASLDDQPSAPGIVVSRQPRREWFFLPVPADRRDVPVGHRPAGRGGPAQCHVGGVLPEWAPGAGAGGAGGAGRCGPVRCGPMRADAVRAALVTTSMW